MRTNAYQNYLENEVLTADPMKLVVLLYRGAVEATGSARRNLKAGDIRARTQATAKALKIIAELTNSLNKERGGALSQQLVKLYDYIQRLLIEASVKQIDRPLAEAEQLLTTLHDAWQQAQISQVDPYQASAGEMNVEMESYERVSYAC